MREVERLADAVEQLPDNTPALALVDGALAFWDLQRGNYPRYVANLLIAERLQLALARRRAASTDRLSRVNYICRLASISFAGSPPWPGPVAGQRWSGSWGRQTPG